MRDPLVAIVQIVRYPIEPEKSLFAAPIKLSEFRPFLFGHSVWLHFVMLGELRYNHLVLIEMIGRSNVIALHWEMDQFTTA